MHCAVMQLPRATHCIPPALLYAFLLHALPDCFAGQSYQPLAKSICAYLLSKLGARLVRFHFLRCRLATILVVSVINAALQGPCFACLFALPLSTCPRSWLWWPSENLPSREKLESFTTQLEHWSAKHGKHKQPRQGSADPEEIHMATEIRNMRRRINGKEHELPHDIVQRWDAAAPYLLCYKKRTVEKEPPSSQDDVVPVKRESVDGFPHSTTGPETADFRLGPTS